MNTGRLEWTEEDTSAVNQYLSDLEEGKVKAVPLARTLKDL